MLLSFLLNVSWLKWSPDGDSILQKPHKSHENHS